MTLEELRATLSQEVFGNTLGEYLFAVAVFFGLLVILQIIKSAVILRLKQWAKKTATDIDDFLIGLFRHAGPLLFFVVAFYVATRSLTQPENVQQILYVFFVIVVTIKAIQVLQDTGMFFLNKWATRTQQRDPTSAAVVKNAGAILRLALWAGAVLFVLSNLGINVGTFVAGLGIGGIAVALAAQAVMGDAFSSFAIFLDRPFEVGDFIIVGDLLGTVEHVGFKTTRIRSLGGEQLVFANSDLTASRIKNYKRMRERRILFKLGVIYQTSADQVQEIPKIIEGVIRSHKMTRFDRAHFQSYGDFALIFEVVYYVLSPDYNTYMDVQQYINVGIMEEFQKAKLEFAYPTQQLLVTTVQPPAPA